MSAPVPVTPVDGVAKFLSGIGKAMSQVKDGIYSVLPEIMVALGDFWPILIPTGIYFIILILNSFRRLFKGA